MSEENTMKKNWAEEEDDEGDDQAIGTGPEQTEAPVIASAEPEAPKKVYPAPPQMARNKFGDFILTDIVIKDEILEVVADLTNSDSDEEESEEEVKEEAVEVKKVQVKQISKKEQKKLDDLEFERLMAENAATE